MPYHHGNSAAAVFDILQKKQKKTSQGHTYLHFVLVIAQTTSAVSTEVITTIKKAFPVFYF